MIASPTTVNAGLADVLTSICRRETGRADSRAYREHDIPAGGIDAQTAIRIDEGPIEMVDEDASIRQSVTLYLTREDNGAASDGTPNVLDPLYSLMAAVDHGLLDAEDTSGTLGGVHVAVRNAGNREVHAVRGFGWIVVPLTLEYGRTAGEA